MIDLSDKLTVAFINAGNDPNASAALQALERQDCKFTLVKIEGYSPMSVAFQEMFNQCHTPFLIQCDSDMILNQNAIKRMYDGFEGNASPTNIVMDCYQLQDVHLQRWIFGIKIYKMDVFRKYPFNLSSPSCEVEQLDRMKVDGYDIRCKNEIVGEHSPHWTNEGIFERYYNLGMKYHLFRYIWMEELPKKLFDMVKQNPTDRNIYAYSGMLASIYSDKLMDEEKDFRKKRKEFGRMQGFLEKPHQATLYVGTTCNFKCKFCFNQHGSNVNYPDMTADLAGEVIAKFPNIKGMCLCGWKEPLTSPNLIPILQKLKSAGKYVGLITNGSLITKRVHELNGWYSPDYISVSLNAHNAKAHEAITQTKTWDVVLDGIKAVVHSKIECYVSYVCTLDNIKYVPEFLKLVHSLGVKTVHLHNLLPHFTNNTDDKYFWDNVLQKDNVNLIDDIKKLPEADIVKSYPILIDRNGGNNVCNFAWYSFSVAGDRSISLCNSVLPANKSMGTLDGFVLWNSKEAQEFRDKFCDGNLPHCKMCFRNFNMGF